jgi:hypothetical protein
MGTPHYEKEFARLSALAENEEGSADSRIKAARKLLYHTEFSARALRVGKRVAKLFLTHGDDSIRTRAANLLVFTVEKKTDEVDEMAEQGGVLTPATPVPGAMEFNVHNPFTYKPVFFDYVSDEETNRILEEARINFGQQPTHYKTEKGFWEPTDAYIQARKDFIAAMNAADKRAEDAWTEKHWGYKREAVCRQ